MATRVNTALRPGTQVGARGTAAGDGDASKPHVKPKTNRKTKTVTYGSATATASVRPKEELEAGFRQTQARLKKALRLFLTPGVELDFPPGVPEYFSDPDHPEILVRVLDGKRERGTLVNGRFKKLRQ